ncbi:MAG TPA: cupin domain-containing protein [Thermoplasmata archaeon]|nr:cupin domain-containing protein [Thermoplasmata archaeon]
MWPPVFRPTVPDGSVLGAPLRGRAVGSPASELEIQEHVADVGSARPRGGIPLHRHRSEDEGWYVLDGQLRFAFGDEEFSASAGAGVLLPHGVPHTFWNPGPGPARYLLIVRPRTAALLRALHGPERPPAADARALYAAFDVDLLE